MENEIAINGQPLLNIALNIVGGIIVVICDRLIIRACKKYTGYRFKKIFGNKVSDYRIVYSELKYENKSNDNQNYIFTKDGINQSFSSTFIIPSCESRAANYLNTLFYKSLGKSVELVTDTKVKTITNLSYCSIGGINNYKSVEIIESISNQFLGLEGISIIYNKSKIEDRFEFSTEYDLCAIIKIKHQGQTKICVSGLGEWGTSGGAWYLEKKWKELVKIVDDNEFGTIIRTKHFSDDSAELVYVVYENKLKIH